LDVAEPKTGESWSHAEAQFGGGHVAGARGEQMAQLVDDHRQPGKSYQ